MDPRDDTVFDELVAERLRAHSPRPDPEFVRTLRERLLPAPRRRFGGGFRIAAGAAVGATTAIVLLLGLAGAGPLSSGDETQATDDCRYVRVERQRQVPVVTTDAKGRPEIVLRRREVTRMERRCR
jgi:hypothetical protein